MYTQRASKCEIDGKAFFLSQVFMRQGITGYCAPNKGLWRGKGKARISHFEVRWVYTVLMKKEKIGIKNWPR